MTEPLIAAADVANGAMVALVPSAPDLERLALEGGEPLDQLHLTLVYLGEADRFTPDVRDALVAAGRDCAGGWDSVEAEAFAPALFNPTGPEPYAVLICSGAELAEFYEIVLADVTELIDLPDDMHVPWCPHITLQYVQPGAGISDSAVVAERMGPVRFDVLRFAFGGDVVDIPLGSKVEAPPAGLPVPAETTPTPAAAVDAEAQTAAAAGPTREVWDGPLR